VHHSAEDILVAMQVKGADSGCQRCCSSGDRAQAGHQSKEEGEYRSRRQGWWPSRRSPLFVGRDMLCYDPNASTHEIAYNIEVSEKRLYTLCLAHSLQHLFSKTPESRLLS
jgi:hypothetical protein